MRSLVDKVDIRVAKTARNPRRMPANSNKRKLSETIARLFETN
jgi:hypothetical protein